MEIVDNAIVLAVPGAMDAGLTSLLFWSSLAFALAVAFVVTFPVEPLADLARAGPRRGPRAPLTPESPAAAAFDTLTQRDYHSRPGSELQARGSNAGRLEFFPLTKTAARFCPHPRHLHRGDLWP